MYVYLSVCLSFRLSIKLFGQYLLELIITQTSVSLRKKKHSPNESKMTFQGHLPNFKVTPTEKLNETCQISGLQAFSGNAYKKEIKFQNADVSWPPLKLIIFVLFIVCWFDLFWWHLDLLKQGEFEVSEHSVEHALEEWSKTAVCSSPQH